MVSPPGRVIYRVSQLNREIRTALEQGFPLMWVEGEVSNLARPASGHLYFSLKDGDAQVRCAMFRNQRLRLRFQPENGAQVLVRARISLFEPRGDLQLLCEHMEPAGEGALRQAFEALKQRLQAEGLFEPTRKRPLPAFPRRIGVITSPSGAAVRDVLTVLRRRMPAVPVVIYPTLVQGAAAPGEIIEMLRLAGERGECDLLILTRGGGSLEDLWAFNDEAVARAIAACPIPLVSAVGHEIDFTIADFVADQRAPTPSAAAELAVPDRFELAGRIAQLHARLLGHTRRRLEAARTSLRHLEARLGRGHPGERLRQQQQRLDQASVRLEAAMRRRLHEPRRGLAALAQRLERLSPRLHLAVHRRRVAELERRLERAVRGQMQERRRDLGALAHQLHAVSPLATLGRGYAIVRRADGEVVRRGGQVAVGERVQALLGEGRLGCRVEVVE